MSSSGPGIQDLINPMRLRLGVKRAFTGDVAEALGEAFQNSARAGARNAQITTDDEGFTYEDDGRGLRNESDFETLIKLGESGWDPRIEEEQQPHGIGVHCLLAHEEVETVTFSSNMLSLTLDAKRWWIDEQYVVQWRNDLTLTMSPVVGLNIRVTCSKDLTERILNILSAGPRSGLSPAEGYHDLLDITLNGEPVNTQVPAAALPQVQMIETKYHNNRLVIGLHGRDCYPTDRGLWINWYGQMIMFPLGGHFKAYLEVRSGRPVNPMSPSRRGVIKDQALQDLLDFIREALAEYFTKAVPASINALALQRFYDDYRERAQTLPIFVAARRDQYEAPDSFTEIAKSRPPEVFSYDRQPLLLADDVRLVDEDGKVHPETYGLHSFLELTGQAYKPVAADESKLKVCHLWWKPGAQISLPPGCSPIFHEPGQWGLGTEDEPPTEWNEVGDYTVFTFNDPDNWDVNGVDFTVGGAQPREFYGSEAWGGFDPYNDERSYEEMSESYGESCDRHIRRIIGNAVPDDFRWEDLIRFVPDGVQITAITPEYKSPRSRNPTKVTLTLGNGEKITLRLV